MNSFVWRWLINTIGLLVVSGLIQGVEAESVLSVVIAAVFLGVLNAVIRPVLLVLTLPINIMTLGIFTVLINALMLKMVSYFVSGFSVIGFWPTIGASLLLSFISMILSFVLKN
ncbi:MAG: phage holin family protein [Clostridiales bacterium]